MKRLHWIPGLTVVLLMALPTLAEGQVSLRDLVVTGGLSGEGYRGNLETAGAAVRDSTEVASAVVSEMGARGGWVLRRNGSVRAALDFDGGVRRFTARGFELRDYAPREWVGTLDLTTFQPLGGSAMLSGFGRVRGRAVEDRPPMPLFLPPAYRMVQGGVGLELDAGGGRRVNLTTAGERSDYSATEFAPQIRLLDRSHGSARVGLTLPRSSNTRVEFFAGGELSRYPEQETFVESDPYRRDRGWKAGVEWTHQGPRMVQLGVEGRTNRSNSRRPEYNSLTVEGMVSAPGPAETILSAYGAVTVKRYLAETSAARLIPGEEANNASMAYLSVSRGLARNLDSTVRLGWTRAETEIGDDYFQRVGLYMLLRYRPRF